MTLESTAGAAVEDQPGKIDATVESTKLKQMLAGLKANKS
jgi:hypothetical protein